MNHKRKIVRKQDQLELLSFGDSIHDGLYQKHSSFRRVVNFRNNNHIISLVSVDVGKGPLNVVLSDFHPGKIHSMAKYDNILQINYNSYQMSENLKYKSQLDLKDTNKQIFLENIMLLKSHIIHAAAEKSLCFLLDSSRERYFKKGFERELVIRLKKSISALSKGKLSDLKKALVAIMGSGFGLTPSGDDFIIGLLFGLHLKQQVFGLDLTEIRNIIYRTVTSDNIFTNTFLWLAKKGLYSEKYKNFIHSLQFEQKNEIIRNINKLLNTGKTSGADTLVGFIYAFKKVGELW